MKSEDSQNESDENVVEAVKNTIDLAKLQKKKRRRKLIALLMLYIALKAVYGIFIDTTMPSNYNNLPMYVVYTLLGVYIMITRLILYKAFRKN